MTDNFGNLIKDKNNCFLTVRLTKAQHVAFRDAARKTETQTISNVLRELVLGFIDNRVTIQRKQVHRSIFDAAPAPATAPATVDIDNYFATASLDDYLQTVANKSVDKL